MEKEIEWFEKAREMVGDNPDMTPESKGLILSNISKWDAEFRHCCIIAFKYCPFTGPIHAVSDDVPKEKKAFQKQTKEYKEFKFLVHAKGWLERGKLPRIRADADLGAFLEKYMFEKCQVVDRFREL
eukprot:2406985-Ditylum_brightwellii.AAC.1